MTTLAESALYRWEQLNRQIGQPLLSNADFHTLYLATRPELHSARRKQADAEPDCDAIVWYRAIDCPAWPEHQNGQDDIYPDNGCLAEMHQLGNGDTSKAAPVSDNECRHIGT